MIDVKNLKKSFGDIHVLKGITTHVNKGECICIIGPSGSGKSTFLRCLNLLEKPEEGEIIVNGQQILDPKLNVDKFRENVDRKSTRLNSSHASKSRMPSSA